MGAGIVWVGFGQDVDILAFACGTDPIIDKGVGFCGHVHYSSGLTSLGTLTYRLANRLGILGVRLNETERHLQGIVGVGGVREAYNPEFNPLPKENRDHLAAEAADSYGCPLVRGAVRPAQLATFHILATQARGGPADQSLSELLRISLGQKNDGVRSPNPLIHRHLDHGIGEKPKEVFAGGVILPELALGGGHHGPIKGGDTGIGIGPEGG